MPNARKVYERPVIAKQHAGYMNKFGSASVNKPMTEIDGVSVRMLAERYGSPLFVISESRIRENQRNALRVFKTRYPKVQFAWSYKTNYLNAVCSVFHQEGAWAEVVSEFEYDRARLLGVRGEHIIFNGPGKSTRGLEKAITEHAKIHIDHFDELYEIAEITQRLNVKAEVAIRVNMDVGIYPKWDRFGFNYENGEAMDALNRIAVNPRLRLVGLHTHIGTYIMSAEAYRAASTKIVELARALRQKYHCALEYVDLGGGLPSHNTLKGQYLPAEQILPSLEQYADAITSPLLELSAAGEPLPVLVLESGRALIDDAGFLISRVNALKRMADGKRAVVVDAGVNILFTSFWFKHAMVPAQDAGVFRENASVFGPLCMNIDCLHEDLVVPTLHKGDYVVLQYVGAYNMTQWMQFITLRPNVVMILADGSAEVIRRAEDLEYVMSRESIPDSLKTFSLREIGTQ